MGTFGGILAAIIIAALLAAAFYYGFKARGPWGSLWTFFLLLLLVIWAGSLWVRPVGPVFWGIAWLPLIFIGLAFALMLAAVPTYDRRVDEEVPEESISPDEEQIERRKEVDSAVAVGWVFWILVLTLVIVIVAGTIG